MAKQTISTRGSGVDERWTTEPDWRPGVHVLRVKPSLSCRSTRIGQFGAVRRMPTPTARRYGQSALCPARARPRSAKTLAASEAAVPADASQSHSAAAVIYPSIETAGSTSQPNTSSADSAHSCSRYIRRPGPRRCKPASEPHAPRPSVLATTFRAVDPRVTSCEACSKWCGEGSTWASSPGSPTLAHRPVGVPAARVLGVGPGNLVAAVSGAGLSPDPFETPLSDAFSSVEYPVRAATAARPAVDLWVSARGRP